MKPARRPRPGAASALQATVQIARAECEECDWTGEAEGQNCAGELIRRARGHINDTRHAVVLENIQRRRYVPKAANVG